MYDLLLKGGRVYDGSGLPSFNGDVGIAGGKIVDIGRLNGSANRTLNVDGLAVAPGFIDPHTHLDAAALVGPARHFVMLSRRYFGGCRQLRFELGAGQSGRPRVGDQEFRPCRGDQPQGA